METCILNIDINNINKHLLKDVFTHELKSINPNFVLTIHEGVFYNKEELTILSEEFFNTYFSQSDGFYKSKSVFEDSLTVMRNSPKNKIITTYSQSTRDGVKNYHVLKWASILSDMSLFFGSDNSYHIEASKEIARIFFRCNCSHFYDIEKCINDHHMNEKPEDLLSESLWIAMKNN